jgi:hypothetical protein
MIWANRPSGLDASIGFETSRPENLGNVEQAINDPSPQNFADRTIIGVSHHYKALYLKSSLTRVV